MNFNYDILTICTFEIRNFKRQNCQLFFCWILHWVICGDPGSIYNKLMHSKSVSDYFLCEVWKKKLFMIWLPSHFGRGFSRLHLKNFIWHRSNKCLRNIENIVTCAFDCIGTRTEILRETDFKFLAKEGLFTLRKVSKYIYLPSLNPSAEQITSFKLFFSNYT